MSWYDRIPVKDCYVGVVCQCIEKHCYCNKEGLKKFFLEDYLSARKHNRKSHNYMSLILALYYQNKCLEIKLLK